MRDIEFRGKIKNRQDWVFGHYSKRGPTHTIRSHDTDVDIEYETLGQYTGRKDKNGVKIFEGDIHKWLGKTGTIKFDAATFWCRIDYEEHPLHSIDYDIEVIGNIHDNPELLI